MTKCVLNGLTKSKHRANSDTVTDANGSATRAIVTFRCLAAVALYMMYYNFGRKHQTLGTTPAVKAKLIPSWMLCKRDGDTAKDFIQDLASRSALASGTLLPPRSPSWD